MVAVDGCLLKLMAVNDDEIFIARRDLAGGYVEETEADVVRAECRRIMAQTHASYDLAMAGDKPAPLSFDELAIKLLPFKGRQLLEWARRNEQAARDTPLDQAYPQDPKKRSLLGLAFTDKSELNGRYQVLLEQAMELTSWQTWASTPRAWAHLRACRMTTAVSRTNNPGVTRYAKALTY